MSHHPEESQSWWVWRKMRRRAVWRWEKHFSLCHLFEVYFWSARVIFNLSPDMCHRIPQHVALQIINFGNLYRIAETFGGRPMCLACHSARVSVLITVKESRAGWINHINCASFYGRARSANWLQQSQHEGRWKAQVLWGGPPHAIIIRFNRPTTANCCALGETWTRRKARIFNLKQRKKKDFSCVRTRRNNTRDD